MNKRVLAVLLSLTMTCPAAGFSVYAENDEPAEIAEELSLSSDDMSLMASSGSCGDNVTYTLDDSGTLTISGTGAMWDYLRNESPFYNKSSIKSVIIEDGVTSIGNYAFYGCSGLTSVTIPDSVTSIGDFAFLGCSGLTSVTIGNGVTSVGSYAFSYCRGITSVAIPDSVTSIGDEAFRDCTGLTSVTIGNGVTSIGNRAFEGCSGLTSVTIPDSVTSIGNRAFNGTAYYNNESNWENGILYINNHLIKAKETITEVSIKENTRTIAGSAFSGCSGLTSVTIPDSVTSIGNSAFYGCSGLTSVTIPDSVTSIGNCAFESCSGITSVTIADGVTSIGNYAFRDCSSLTSVTIPDSVTSIDYYAFYNCSGLTSVTIPDSVTSIGNSAFYGCSGLTSVYISDLAAYLNISFGSGDSNPMCNASRLYINNKRLTGKLIIPDGVTAIPAYAFSGCDGITSVTIPDSVTSIGSDAFRECFGITSVTIGDGVTSVGTNTFYDCGRLKEIVIPASVTRIGQDAFSGCLALTDVEYGGSEADWDEISFGSGNGYLRTATIHYNSSGVTDTPTPIPTTAPGVSYSLDDGTLTISGTGAMDNYTGVDSPFYNNSSIRSVIIEDGVTSIGSFAFFGCDGITSVTIPATVTSVGSYAFSYCPALSDVEYYGNEADWGNISIDSGNENLKNAARHYIIDYPYTINSLSLQSETGEALDGAPQGSAFIVRVSLTKTEERTGEDYLFIAVYDKKGKLIGLDYVQADFTKDKPFSSGFYVPAQTGEIGKVKAFVWSSFISGEPLAEPQSLAW